MPQVRRCRYAAHLRTTPRVQAHFGEMNTDRLTQERNPAQIGPLLFRGRPFGAGLLALLAACSNPADFERAPLVQNRLTTLELALADEEDEASRASRTHLEIVRNSPNLAIRLHSLEELRFTEHDWIVPHLLQQLRRERTDLGRIALAHTLANFGNYAGLKNLFVLKASGSGRNLQARAAAILDRIVEEAAVEDSTILWELWSQGDPNLRLPRTRVSARHEFELWKWVARLDSEKRDDPGGLNPEKFEDARFVLANQASWAAPRLAVALHDSEDRIAVGAARTLGAMGKRGLVGAPALMEALGAGGELALEAATALGAVGDPRAVEPLLDYTAAEQAPELRLACIRSLGRLGLPASFEVLEQLMSAETEPKLRLAAAEALIHAAGRESAARLALEFLKHSPEHAGPSQRALERWLRQRAQAGDSKARQALATWTEPPGPPGIEPTTEERAAQRLRRIAAVEALLIASAQE